MLVSEQIKAARSLLDWTAKDLANKSGISLATIQRMESPGGTDNALGKNLSSVQAVLEKGGVIFIMTDNIGGPGVRLKK